MMKCAAMCPLLSMNRHNVVKDRDVDVGNTERILPRLLGKRSRQLSEAEMKAAGIIYSKLPCAALQWILVNGIVGAPGVRHFAARAACDFVSGLMSSPTFLNELKVSLKLLCGQKHIERLVSRLATKMPVVRVACLSSKLVLQLLARSHCTRGGECVA